MSETERRHAAVAAFLDAARTGDRVAYVASLKGLDWPSAWIDVFNAVVLCGNVDPNTQKIFAEQWDGSLKDIEIYSPAGVHMRQIFSNNLDLLVRGLRILIPPFLGICPDILYRGQRIKEHELGIVGLSWTPSPLLAEIYSRSPLEKEIAHIVLALYPSEGSIIGAISEYELIIDHRQISEPFKILRPKTKISIDGSSNTYELMHIELIFREQVAARAEMMRVAKALPP